MGLTKRQQLFVYEYCADPKIGQAEAARRAGFSDSRAPITACELMRNPEIKAAIEIERNKKFQKLSIDENMVLVGIQQTIDRAIAAGSGAWQSATLLKAYELLGRHLKMFTDKVQVGLDDQLMERLLAGRKHAGLPEASAEGEPTAELPEHREPTAGSGNEHLN